MDLQIVDSTGLIRTRLRIRLVYENRAIVLCPQKMQHRRSRGKRVARNDRPAARSSGKRTPGGPQKCMRQDSGGGMMAQSLKFQVVLSTTGCSTSAVPDGFT